MTRLHSSQGFKTLEGDDIHAAEEVVKKSRFIGYASHWCVIAALLPALTFRTDSRPKPTPLQIGGDCDHPVRTGPTHRQY